MCTAKPSSLLMRATNETIHFDRCWILARNTEKAYANESESLFKVVGISTQYETDFVCLVSKTYGNARNDLILMGYTSKWSGENFQKCLILHSLQPKFLVCFNSKQFSLNKKFNSNRLHSLFFYDVLVFWYWLAILIGRLLLSFLYRVVKKSVSRCYIGLLALPYSVS